MVMIAHISVPAITGDDLPATMSPKIIEGLLREKMGYNGVVLPDSHTMGAISTRFTQKEACIKSFEAGCDFLLFQTAPGGKNDFISVYNAMLAEYTEARISAERLDTSARRILTMKLRLGW